MRGAECGARSAVRGARGGCGSNWERSAISDPGSARAKPDGAAEQDGARGCEKAEKRSHLDLVEHRTREEGGVRKEQGDGEADPRGHAEDHCVRGGQAVRARGGRP